MMGTVTGRLSSREPNLNNVLQCTKEVAQIRAAVVKQMRPVETDWSDVEKRVLSQMEVK